MSDTVWNYTLNKTINDLAIPDGGQILTVAEQYGQVTMWVRVNPDAYVLPRTFYVVGTGTDIPDGPTVYRGTAITCSTMSAAPASTRCSRVAPATRTPARP